MAIPPKKQQPIFPDLPRESPAVDKDGRFTGIWSLGLASLFQALQRNFKNEGIVFPNLDAQSIANIQAIYTSYINTSYAAMVRVLPDISGQTVFDTDNRVSKQFVIAKNNAPDPLVTLAEWVPFAVMLKGSGNPNQTVFPTPANPNAQAGLVSWQYYDIIGTNLYICITAGNNIYGSGNLAVWKLVA